MGKRLKYQERQETSRQALERLVKLLAKRAADRDHEASQKAPSAKSRPSGGDEDSR